MTNFADFDISAFNANPLNAPIDDAEGFLQRINANECSSIVKSFFSNPCTLVVNEQDNGSISGGGKCLRINDEQYKQLYFSKTYTHQTIKLPIKYEHLLTLENIKKNYIDRDNVIALVDMIKTRDAGNVIHANGIKSICDVFYTLQRDRKWNTETKQFEYYNASIHFSLHFKNEIPKGLTKDDIKTHNDKVSYRQKISTYQLFSINSALSECSEKLRAVEWCFKIIQKEFKLLQESKRDYYTKYFTSTPFTAFEECGIEVFYARKGYAIDGKRLPNFNRGSVYGLKHSIRQNNLKLKDVGGSGKKDDLIKFLMKL